MLWNSLVALFAPVISNSASVQSPLTSASSSSESRTAIFDIQAHRGGRGNVVENTLPAFAWALINGANTLELDNGITKDGHVIVWHDEDIVPEKCWDTAPAFQDDPDFPYAGKVLSQLTLAQIKTLDCGSQRQATYPLQATYPGTRISTLQEFFDFVSCADPEHQMKFNIESKINPEQPNKTRGPEEFVVKQHAIFSVSPYAHAITYQSFDWRSLMLMKKLDPRVLLSGLVDDETVSVEGRPSIWFGGMQVDDFPGHTRTAKLSQMAASMGIHILSPVATGRQSPSKETSHPGYIPFVDEAMVREAHRAGLVVKPWTVNTLSVAERLMELGVDGLISDYPDAIRRWAKGRGLPVASRYPSSRVLACLAKHNQLTTPSHMSNEATQSGAVGPAVNDSQSVPIVDSDSVPPAAVPVVVAASVSST